MNLEEGVTRHAPGPGETFGTSGHVAAYQTPEAATVPSFFRITQSL